MKPARQPEFDDSEIDDSEKGIARLSGFSAASRKDDDGLVERFPVPWRNLGPGSLFA
jgi:hypothetical protein